MRRRGSVWRKGVLVSLCFILNSSVVAVAAEGEPVQDPIAAVSEVSGEQKQGEVDGTGNVQGTDPVQQNTDAANENGKVDQTEGEAVEETPVLAPETSDQTGWFELESNKYYYDSNKARANGWRKISGKWYYFDGADAAHPGIMLSDTVRQIEGKYYVFDAAGVMQKGWFKRAEGWYYANKDGSLALGWKKLKGKWYYLDANNAEHPALMVENRNMLIDGKYYGFHTSGSMYKGWFKRAEGWYYANSNGSLAFGWKKLKGKWYYLDQNNADYVGLMVGDATKLIDGAYYGFNASGAMLKGWIQRPEGWYYANSNGSFAMKWKKSKNKWYYLNPADQEYPGRMASNTTMEIDGLPYRFLESGAMANGLQTEDGNTYYYHPTSGQKLGGWQKVSGKWYYFMPDTKQMLGGGWHDIDGDRYYMHANGVMATGWQKIDNKWYYFGSSGKMRVDWQKINGCWYYFYTLNDSHGGEYGVMAANTTIDGYKILEDGTYLTAVQRNMNSRAQGYSSPTRYLIMIDTKNCKVGVYTGSRGNWKTSKYWGCSPGAAATPTVKGVFSVGSKGYYFDSGHLRLYWYTQFYGDYLIHSACYYKSNGKPADLRIGLHLSHGCVRLDINNAKWVYDNIPRGTTVVCY